MITRRQIRAFTLSPDVSRGVDEMCAIVCSEPTGRGAGLIKALGLLSSSVLAPTVDAYGMTEKDYAALRAFIHLPEAAGITGLALMNKAVTNPATRAAVHRMVVTAQRNNRKVLAESEKRLPINASRIVDALIRLGLAAIIDVAAPHDLQVSVTSSQPPLTSWEIASKGAFVLDPARKAFIESSLSSQPVISEKAAKNATTVAPRGARRNARKTA